MRQTWGSYSLSEVEGLVNAYIEVQTIRTNPNVWFRVMDLEVHMRRMPYELRLAVFLLGIAGQTTRHAGEVLGVSHQTVVNRYQTGLEWLVMSMNGGHPEH